jgi:hypothetical protein
MVIEPFEFDGLPRASGFILDTVVNVRAKHRKHSFPVVSWLQLTAKIGVLG